MKNECGVDPNSETQVDWVRRLLTLLFFGVLANSAFAAQDVFKIPLDKGAVIISRGKIACNPTLTAKTDFAAWGIWNFNDEGASFECGPGKQVDNFRVSAGRPMPFSEVLIRNKGRQVRSSGNFEYFEYVIAGRAIDELVVFVGSDGKQVVVRRPTKGSAGYTAYRIFRENVDVSYVARRTGSDDRVLFENDRKILRVLNELVRVE